jgi:hypothetical protein
MKLVMISYPENSANSVLARALSKQLKDLFQMRC